MLVRRVIVSLNEQQKKSIEHFNGPCLVIGTPGSGKTKVITERVKYLVEEKNIKNTNILVITFTKAAAVQMKKRYEAMASGEVKRVYFGTFHAIFFTILKYAYHYTADNIIRDDMKRQILKELVNKEDIEIQDENDFLNDLESEISKVKGEMLNLKHYYSPNCPGESFRKIFNGYQHILESRRLIDFDDMLVYCYELLKAREDIRQMWQRQYPYILIDEFQDINKVQYDIVKMLAAPKNNIFIVGDDDQSIYGFRGAKPDIMKQFLKDFPEAKEYVLGINYRCSGAVVESAAKLISKNENRLEKTLKANNNYGEKVEIKEFNKISEECESIRAKILEYKDKGIPYSEMAVLFRTNTQARTLSSKLMEYNIPFVMKERIPNMYDHWIARDIITYIKIAKGSRERADFLRIINRPKRYVHRTAFTDSVVDIDELKKYYEDKEWMIERFEQLEYDLKMLSNLKPFAAVNFIRSGIGYDEYIKEYADYRGMRADEMMDFLDELQEEAKGFENFEQWFEYIKAYGDELKEQAVKSKLLNNGQEQSDAVLLMTMHGVKGLEYECVFIPDANEGVTPHSKAVLDADMEEERRMFYVAMTRAKKYLHIYYVKERFNKEADISRFVYEVMGKDFDEAQRNKEKSKQKRNLSIEREKRSLKSGSTAKVINSKPYVFGQTNIRYKKE